MTDSPEEPKLATFNLLVKIESSGADQMALQTLAGGGRTIFGPCFLFPAGADLLSAAGTMVFCEIL